MKVVTTNNCGEKEELVLHSPPSSADVPLDVTGISIPVDITCQVCSYSGEPDKTFHFNTLETGQKVKYITKTFDCKSIWFKLLRDFVHPVESTIWPPPKWNELSPSLQNDYSMGGMVQ